MGHSVADMLADESVGGYTLQELDEGNKALQALYTRLQSETQQKHEMADKLRRASQREMLLHMEVAKIAEKVKEQLPKEKEKNFLQQEEKKKTLELEAKNSDLQSALSTTQSRLDSTESTLSTTQSKLSTTQSTLSTTQSALSSTQSALSSTQSQLSDTESMLNTMRRERADIFQAATMSRRHLHDLCHQIRNRNWCNFNPGLWTAESIAQKLQDVWHDKIDTTDFYKVVCWKGTDGALGSFVNASFFLGLCQGFALIDYNDKEIDYWGSKRFLRSGTKCYRVTRNGSCSSWIMDSSSDLSRQPLATT